MLINSDRSKQHLNIKLQFLISHSILNEIQRFKVHDALQSTIYPMHNIITTIIEIEFQPLGDSSAGFACFKMPIAKIELDWSLPWCMIINNMYYHQNNHHNYHQNNHQNYRQNYHHTITMIMHSIILTTQ